MADGTRTVRVRLSVRSALAIVFALAATVLLLEIAQNAERVIAWVFCAAAIAGLVYPAIVWLSKSRFVPRGVAVLIVVLLGLGTIGFLGYKIVNDVSDAMTRVQEAAPARAEQLEKDSDFWRELKLKQRVTRFVDDIPARLRGGEPTEALKTNATRGIAFLAGLILTVFFVLYGQRLMDGALGLIDDEATRRRAEFALRDGSRRAFFYARVKLWEAAVEGFLAYSIARLAGVPGPAALGVWVALWSFLPVAGVLIGALPIVVFAGANSVQRAVAVGLAFVVIGIFDYFVNRWLERRSVYVGSFAIVLAAFVGLELYGLTGALLFIFGAIFTIAIISEIGPEEVGEVVVAAGIPAEGGS